MKDLLLLDCTLRDGGYVNDWNFGSEATHDILSSSLASNVDIVEIGFLREDSYRSGRVVFNSMQQAQKLLSSTMSASEVRPLIAAMAEISNPISPELVEPAHNNDIDIIRVIVWKSRRNEQGVFVDALKDSYEYCKKLAEKGYKLCVQPNRSNQYTDEEFRNMLEMFAELSPMAIYVVDSWGTMYSDQVIHYMEMADKILPPDIAIGFHGHNNMQQAFGNAERIVERDFNRRIILDASVYGIGRGAGNLPLELIARYLNERCGKEYKLDPMIEMYDRCVKGLREKYTWGSSMPFFLSADANANPDYAPYFDKKADALIIKKIISQMTFEERLIFSRECADKYLGMQ